MPRRHVCINQRNVTYPVRTKRVFCKPTYKKYMVRCGTQWCEGVRLVYEKYHKEVVANSNHTYIDYTCCPGWTQVTWKSHGCNKPVCSYPCQNGGKCVKPNQCLCQPGYTGTFCETKTSYYAPNDCCCSPGVSPPSVCPQCLRFTSPTCSVSCAPSPLCLTDCNPCPVCNVGPPCAPSCPPPCCPPSCCPPPCCPPPCCPPVCCPASPAVCAPPCSSCSCYSQSNVPCSCRSCSPCKPSSKRNGLQDQELDEGTTLEASDLEQQKMDKMDKRLQKLEKMLKEKMNNEVTRKELEAIYGNINKLSVDISDMSDKLQQLDTTVKKVAEDVDNGELHFTYANKQIQLEHTSKANLQKSNTNLNPSALTTIKEPTGPDDYESVKHVLQPSHSILKNTVSDKHLK